MWTYRAVVMRVIDGDTLEVRLDLGLTVNVTVTLRLEGVWAVERSHPAQPQIVAAVQGWLDEHGDGSAWPIVVRTVRLKSDAREVTTLARYVGQVSDKLGTSSLNAYMTAWLAARGLTGGVGA